MSKLGKAVAASGAIDEGMLQELQKWKVPLNLPDTVELETDVDAVISRIQEAISDKEMVEIRDTDLDLLKRFLRDRKKGRLYLVSDSTGEKTNFTIRYCVTSTGEYAIPWESESIEDMLVADGSYLKTDEGRVYFHTVRECFFGEHKAFIVCSGTLEKKDGSSS
jgi:hypothetical protein